MQVKSKTSIILLKKSLKCRHKAPNTQSYVIATSVRNTIKRPNFAIVIYSGIFMLVVRWGNTLIKGFLELFGFIEDMSFGHLDSQTLFHSGLPAWSSKPGWYSALQNSFSSTSHKQNFAFSYTLRPIFLDEVHNRACTLVRIPNASAGCSS